MEATKEKRALGISAVFATETGIGASYVATLGAGDAVWLGVGEYAWFGAFWLSFGLVQWYRLFRRLDSVGGVR